MKRTIATFLVLAATTTGVAVAQDGTGHGPPPTVIVAPQLPLPTPTVPTTSVPKVSQPAQ